MHRHGARRRLGGIHQVAGQLFQPGALAVQHGDVFLYLRVIHWLGFDQIHIIDDRSQRRLDVVGYIRDQFTFQPFTFHLLFQRRRHTLGNPVQIPGVVFQGSRQMTGVDSVFEISPGQFCRAVAHCAEFDRPAASPQQHEEIDNGQQEKNTRRVGRQKQHQRYKLIRHIGQHKFPGQIHMVDHVRTQAREAGTQARQAAQQGMAPEGTRFQAYSSRHDTHLRKHTQITEICPHCKNPG